PANSHLLDQYGKQQAIRQILSHPFKHLAVSLPIAWRSIFVERGFLILGVKIGLTPISLIYFAALFYLLIASIKLKEWPLLAMISPPIYLFIMNAGFTHGIPRFNQESIPILVTVTLFVFHRCLVYMRRRLLLSEENFFNRSSHYKIR